MELLTKAIQQQWRVSALLALFLAAVAGVAAHAQGTGQVPASSGDAKLKVIYSTLSDYKYGTYYCCGGNGIEGPNTQLGTFWRAVPFTPPADTKLMRVQLGLAWPQGGNSLAVWLAEDADGLPGNTLAGPLDVVIPQEAWACCVLTVAAFDGVPLARGTRYWLAVGTDLNSESTEVIWEFDAIDMRTFPVALNKGDGWKALMDVLPAVRILGK